MSVEVSDDELVAQSQMKENRLRALESAMLVLIGNHLMSAKDRKANADEIAADLTQCAESISFTIRNYPA